MTSEVGASIWQISGGPANRAYADVFLKLWVVNRFTIRQCVAA